MKRTLGKQDRIDKISSQYKEEEKENGDKWRRLLKPYKVIKDPVHKDIWLTELETKIIDTPEFQRLRYIHQLGPAYLIYPGGKHTRFDHSLGTLFVAQRIVDSIQKNARLYTNAIEMDYREILLTRLAALLHDAAHLPFGHLMEDEGKIVKNKQWMDHNRANKLLGSNSKIRTNIKEVLKNNGFGNKEIEELIKDLIDILQYEEKEGAERRDDFKMKYISDIVGNTICADLLDYLKRDVYFTGIFGEYDERLFAYFALVEDDNKKLVIKLSKPDVNDLRRDVISAITDLMNLRYSIAEKVYFHHTRQKLSAMIIEMVEAAFKAEILNEEKLFEMGDDSLLKYIADYKSCKGKELNDIDKKKMEYIELAENMAKNVLNRELYNVVFKIERWQFDHGAETRKRVSNLIEDWESRFDTERFIEERLRDVLGFSEVKAGSVIIYAPPPKMAAKREVQTLVEYRGDICSLQELASNHPQLTFIKDYIDLIRRKHESLWNLLVLCDKKVPEGAKKQIERFFGELLLHCVVGRDMVSFMRKPDGVTEELCINKLDEAIASETMPTTGISPVRHWYTTAEVELSK